MRRVVLGALCLAHVPFLGWISLVTTPRAPYWLAVVVPLSVAGVYLWRSR